MKFNQTVKTLLIIISVAAIICSGFAIYQTLSTKERYTNKSNHSLDHTVDHTQNHTVDHTQNHTVDHTQDHSKK